MKKQFVAAGFVLFSFMLPLKATAASITNFNQLYVFGDSLSDPGNTYNASGKTYPLSPPYDNGRFSNGPLWVENLGDQLNLHPTLLTNPALPTEGINFAFGGASSGLDNAVRPNVGLPGVLAQVLGFADSLQKNNQKANPDALYTLWGGANDFLFLNDTDYTTPTNNISQALNILTSDAVGAKNILVFNLPDVAKLPAVKLYNLDPKNLSQSTKDFNLGLEKTLSILNQNPNLNIMYVDTYSLFEQAIANKEKFELTNVTDACFNPKTDITPCSNPDEYLFWDEYHPTATTHKEIANLAFSAIQAKSVPEPSTALGTLAIGAWGAAAVLKRKRKKLLVTTANRVPDGQSTRIKVES